MSPGRGHQKVEGEEEGAKETRETGCGTEEVVGGAPPVFPTTFPSDVTMGGAAHDTGYNAGWYAPGYVSDSNFRAPYRGLFGDLGPAFLPVDPASMVPSGSSAIHPPPRDFNYGQYTGHTHRAPRPTGPRPDVSGPPADRRQGRQGMFQVLITAVFPPNRPTNSIPSYPPCLIRHTPRLSTYLF